MVIEMIYKLQVMADRFRPRRVMGLYRNKCAPSRGSALVSYMPLPLVGDPAFFKGHSNVWESAEVVATFNRLGYRVDLLNWRDASFVPPAVYDIVFDIHGNLSRYSAPRSSAVFYVTGSNPSFSNRAEQERLDAVARRRGASLKPRRKIGEEEIRTFNANLERADLILLVGNETTAGTFPEHIRRKMRCICATGSYLPSLSAPDLRGNGREFLWFNGQGAVHKGLDLVLEVFARHRDLTLHVVGPYLKEDDFVSSYRRELTELPNIRSHGFLYPAGKKFRQIAARTGFFISPSCSEGMSTSAITCMQHGMIPILSANCGITLPAGVGRVLDTCSVEEIEEAVLSMAALSDGDRREMMEATGAFAAGSFTREGYSRTLEDALAALVRGAGA
ncbi:glycosyltransferase [Geobacter sp. DSM 9736]|uniref:glycosyltransferase n=1 Tax=Geobacter sp. DSM 9736 TaxID=1277350 RepID=UPI000B511C79|nr:glycosyltransferase [Geobacter sp. DSM 9736]SNB46603.1 Glycosyltransferase involved in cell wall bisynthesis [Geobacter sp. DSM 9736]